MEDLQCGKPWIFKQILDYLNFGKYDKNFPNNEEKLKVILEHLNLEIEEKGEKIAIKEMRKHLACYVKSIQDASKLREKINVINDKQQLTDCLIEYFRCN